MKTYMKIAIVALVAVIVMTFAATGTVYAASPQPQTTSGNPQPAQAVASKVAEILGLNASDVANAFSLARQEMRNESIDENRFEVFVNKSAVILGIEDEVLAQAISQARIEICQETMTRMFNNLLDKALQRGIITENESNEIRAWWEGRPAAVNKLLEQARHQWNLNRQNGNGQGQNVSMPVNASGMQNHNMNAMQNQHQNDQQNGNNN